MISWRLWLYSVILARVLIQKGESAESLRDENNPPDTPYVPNFLRARYDNIITEPSFHNAKSVKGRTYSAKSGHDIFKRVYSGNTDVSYTKSFSHRTGVKSSTTSNVKNGKFTGGCTAQPASPINGKLRCSVYSGCRATCIPNYIFPNGETQLIITCQDEEWHIQGTEWSSIPHCEPICLPVCQNNGICTAPNQCNCPENFSGPQCQFENRPCLNQPPLPANSRRQCSSKACTISCARNHVFPDGSAIANLICKNGNWEPTRLDWVSIPDCEPVCSPPCKNGGNCLALNVCQCPQEFRGPQCQYSADACSTEKIGFNGGYNCTITGDSYTCMLSCPAGVEFEFSPATSYTCTYDRGIFEPQPIPQCQIDKNVEVVPIDSSHKSFFKVTNHSWSFEDIFGSIVTHTHQTGSEYNIAGSYDLHDSNVKLNNKNINENKYDARELSNMNNVFHSTIDKSENNVMLIEQKRPEPKVCFTWGGTHYKTFDGKMFSFESDCAHTLLQDSRDGTFTITARNSPGCNAGGLCFRMIKIFIQGKEYSLTLNDDGIPEFRSPKKILPVPAQLPGLRAEMAAHFLVVTLDSVGTTVKWDGALFVQIEASESLWNKTTGLCGTMDGDDGNDLTNKDGSHPKSVATLATSWQVKDIGETCHEYPNIRHSCLSNEEFAQDANQFCSKLLSDRRFHVCSNVMNLAILEATCRWDYCACKDRDKRKCACNTVNVYVRQCAHKGVATLSDWRDNDTCPMKCTGGRVYMSCGPKTQPSCGTSMEMNINGEPGCEEGCFCSDGSVLHDGKCISPEMCPCRLRGKLFQPAASVRKDCNTCTCSSGKWICTQTRCSARCAAVGDPHYVTFDGKRYDFMGKCSYYLVKGDDYSIEGENVACPGAISKNMGFAPSVESGVPSCTKTVTIRLKDVSIKLKQNRQLLINGEEVTKLPLIASGAKIRIVSSIFLVVHLPNSLEVWWDGISRVYVNAPAKFHGKTKGLCGTFSTNQKDDFLTPDGDVEQVVVPFANKWKTSEQCLDAPKADSNHPCDANPQKRSTAESYCSKLYTDLFSGCHWYVDPEPFYKDCMYDMCACENDIGLCFCPMLAAYAKECSHLGVKISWRQEIDECKIHCPGGQVYQICGNSCTRSCEDISFYQDCRQECVEGCNCPEGQTLDINGECIPIGQCPCEHAGLEFTAGHREVRPGVKEQELCTCAGGVWSCRPATTDEIRDYPPAADLKSACSSSKNQEVTTCEPIEPKTCRNMHESIDHSPAVCKAGCTCKSGYVLDSPSGKCVKEEECPCYHGGKSYKEGSVMQEECNTCKCVGGKWKCTARTCAGVCSAWGDSHYKTFDGKLYDFQGICDYVLVKGSLSKEETFDISTQNVPCGSTGVSCSKAVTLTVGIGTNQEAITLTRGKELPKESLKRIALRSAGLFVFLDVPDLGLVLQWDEGTRVYVRLNPKWKGRTKGLCGDYNDNSEDDFKTPSGGVFEVSANLFGDSWKKENYCPESKDITDTCKENPDRRIWAIQKCGILKSSEFQSCHSEVDVEPYLQRCIFDACGCDLGGDCECFCTALAAYTQECNARGVPIKWRSQKLCPIQCDENCSTYSPCISTCPRETCTNLVTLSDGSHLCAQDSCVEGCLPKPCPDGQVYQNDSYSECVPKTTCKPLCLEINGVYYYEGDEVKSDECQTCFCSRGKVVCKGEPCTTITTEIPTVSTTILKEEPHKCIDGWTAWLNKDSPIKGKKVSDIEPLPTSLDLLRIKGSAVCEREHMVDIRCRSVKRQLTPKETGLNVECSLERGLYCQSGAMELPCMDFEISVLCRCNEGTTAMLETTTGVVTTMSTTTKEEYEPCNVTKPNQSHPRDCHSFYKCVPGTNGPELVENNCGADMLYSPSLEACDLPANVISERPECFPTETTQGTTKWTSESTKNIVTSSTVSTPFIEEITTPAYCKEGEVWSECAVQCSRTCAYYQYLLTQRNLCSESRDCVSGCVSVDRVLCPSHKFWRDSRTCVSIADCTCKSHDGKAVKPDAVVKESECESCQCLNNHYTCDKLCITTERVSVATEQVFITTEEPMLCDESNYIPLIDGEPSLSDEAFDASTTSNDMFKPSYARLNNTVTETSGGSWTSEEIDKKQWISVDLGREEPVYGVILQGSPLFDEYVETYNVYYSPDGNDNNFIPITSPGFRLPKIFNGPQNKDSLNRVIFDKPVYARKVKIAPQSWHNGIAVRLELIGCNRLSTVRTEGTSTVQPVTTERPTEYSEKEITTSTEKFTFEVKTTTSVPITEYTFVIPSSVSPPQHCSEEDYVWLIKNTSPNDIFFNASSSKGPAFNPKNSKLNDRTTESSAGSWEPEYTDAKQWLQIEFIKPEPIYGIILQGSPLNDKYVTSYTILFSEDGQTFSYVSDDKKEPKVFQGPVDRSKPVKQIFYKPVEAKVIRINPQTWHNGIAIRAELIGCMEYLITTEKFTVTSLASTVATEVGNVTENIQTQTSPRTTMYTEKSIKPVCDDRMGLDDGIMSDQQVSSSLSFDGLFPNIQLSSPGVWRPKLDNPDQYVQFDFLGARNLTGVETKGGDNIWTTVYKVLYSPDGRQWNPVVDSAGADKEFLANFDDKTPKINYFEIPLHATFLRVQPIKWHEHIGLKVEVHGCFLPYPSITTPMKFEETWPTATVPAGSQHKCNICEGIPKSSDDERCKCAEPNWWDGESCVTKQECPCVVGHIPYAVGSSYETEDCQQCTCVLGGTAACRPKKCEPCDTPGLQSVVTELCSCICKPCADGTRLCPTSNICINETSWCNGVQDCPDDERDCQTTVATTPMTTRQEFVTTVSEIETTVPVATAVTELPCQDPVCPPTYKIVLKRKQYFETINILQSPSSKGTKSGAKGGVKGGHRGVKGSRLNSSYDRPMKDEGHRSTEIECPQFSCVPKKPPPLPGNEVPTQLPCLKVVCPPGYTIVYEKMSMYKLERCPRYTCRPPAPIEVVCNITGRTFNTFDHLEYKYDICNHILARDMDENNWYITLEKQCDAFNNSCKRVLVITVDDHVLVLYPDMSVDIDEYTFTPSQVMRLSDKQGAFKISRIGNILHFASHRYGFWIIWDVNSNVKIGVTIKLTHHVDGLCGYFDGYSLNDRQKPDGSQARSTVDFGNSWAMENTPECESQVCPRHVQEQAWKICNSVKDHSLTVCSGILNLDKFVSRCLETACTCLRSSNSTGDDCRCRELTSFVTECQAADQSIDLSTWRSVHNCLVQCQAPFVHKDCFRNKCETSCDNLQEVEPCPIMQGVCFSGCFCPDGTVRKGDDCVLATECRDCICDGFGNSKFVSFDRTNFTFNGNCTYILSRDIVDNVKGPQGEHTYQILVTNVACNEGLCTEAITILYQTHSVHIKQGLRPKEIIVIVDGRPIEEFPYKTPWMMLDSTPGRDITLLIPAIQLEVASFRHNFAFMVRLPSHTFAGAMEGLCGDCDGNSDDDLRKRNGETADSVEEFGSSWLAVGLPPALNLNEENCASKPIEKCVPPPLDQSPCSKLLNPEKFGQCHKLVDPVPYLAACQDSYCDGSDICDDFEAYARNCLQAGLCPDWRTSEVCPYKCPSDLVYRPCGPGCKETCDDIDRVERKKCPLNPTEGCFCPDDYVVHNNGTCILKKKCLICDEEGHVEGDVWYPDRCTKCSCDKKTVNCQKTECPALETVCEERLTPIAVPGTEDECCVKYLCVPEPTVGPTCVEPQQPECGYGQVMKSTTSSDGCQKLVCQCLPAEECPSFENVTLEVEEMRPGYVQVMNVSGCCPRLAQVCEPETCPKAPQCPSYYKVVANEQPNSCCPNFKCEPPTDVCLYNVINNNDLTSMQNVIPKKIGEQWQDGKCKTCSCDNSNDGPVAICMTTECPNVQKLPDINDFVLEEILLEDQCCPNFERTACRDDERIYKIGDSWKPNLNDVCTTVECINGTHGVQKQIKTQECDTTCDKGYDYRPSSDKSISCCGQCIGTACVIGGELRKIGEKWHSEDRCINYACLSDNGTFHVQAITETCQEIDSLDEQEFKIERRPVAGKCCPDIVKTACRHNGKIYKPGDTWISPNDSCTIQMCVDGPNGVTMQQEAKCCNKHCSEGWEYQEPENNECCGECKQRFCIFEEILYKPGLTWSSDDNCTTFTCSEQGNQLVVSSSSKTCPSVADCTPELIYDDGCCKRCNMTVLGSNVACVADVIDLNSTIGVLTEKHGAHGLCKNLQPVYGLTECSGNCMSSTHFDTASWSQESDCRCCQPVDYTGLIVELMCEDGKQIEKQLSVPTSCSCKSCSS